MVVNIDVKNVVATFLYGGKRMKEMKCRNCNQEAVEGAKFCMDCWWEANFEAYLLRMLDERGY
jgi:hypothetical protein